MNNSARSIVFVTNNYTPYQGGVVSSINVSAQELRRLGHKVTLITLDFARSYQHEEGVIRLFCPIKFTYKTNPMAWPLWARHELLKLFKQLKPHIIHLHHPFLLGKAGLYAAKKLDIPCVFTYHTFYHYYLHYLPLPEVITCPLVNYLVRAFCNEVDGIIAPSNAAYDYLKSLNVMAPITTLATALLPHYFIKQPIKQDKGSYFNLVTVSRFAPEKNITALLDVMSMLDHTRFILTLVGYGPAYKQLWNYAYRIKKFSPLTVRFVERPSKDELVKIYQHADLFLFASKTETQGLVLAEAMAQGTPVIALDGPGQRDVIINGYNGYLVDGIYEMKNKIEFIASDSTLHSQLVLNAQATALQYHPAKLVLKLLEFYKQYY